MRKLALGVVAAALASLAPLPGQGTWQPFHGAPDGACRLVTDQARSRLVAISQHPHTRRLAHHEWDGQRWVDRSERTPTPSRDYGYSGVLPSMAYDEARQRVVLFGGLGSTAFDDHWEYDGEHWQAMAPITRPTARGGAAITYDRARARIVLHGGVDWGRTMGDVWEFTGQTWVQRTFALQPGPQALHVMAYDGARQVCVLCEVDGTTWTYDGNAWTRMPASGASPGARRAPAMSYDPLRQRIVLTGGDSSSAVTGTREWDGAAWHFGGASGGWDQAGIAFDPNTQRTVRAGGEHFRYGSASSTSTYDGITWTTAQPPVVAGPLLTATYDSARRKIVAQGGYHTWESNGIHIEQHPHFNYRLPDWGGVLTYDPVRRVSVLFGGSSWGQAGLVDWTSTWDGQRWAPASSGPAARQGHGMAFDRTRNAVLMFGGNNNNSPLNDTWQFNGTWTQLQPAHRPSTRWGMAMASDQFRSTILLFGGIGSGASLNDTWEWNGNDWLVQAPPTVPQARRSAAMVFDPSRFQILMYGGTEHISSLAVPGTVWSWNGQDWTAVDSWPSAYEPRLLLDEARQAFVLSGGIPVVVNDSETAGHGDQ